MSRDGMLSRRRRRPGVVSGLRSPSAARLPDYRASMPFAQSEKTARRAEARLERLAMDG
jgi:hypothetical protein